MTKREYVEYEANVREFFEREGINCLSTESDDETGESKEAYFSWRGCDCCGSHLGGNHYDCSGYNPTMKEVQDGYEVCEDCMYYAEYGQLDDMSMMEIENDNSIHAEDNSEEEEVTEE